jgi:hypothetical protein
LLGEATASLWQLTPLSGQLLWIENVKEEIGATYSNIRDLLEEFGRLWGEGEFSDLARIADADAIDQVRKWELLSGSLCALSDMECDPYHRVEEDVAVVAELSVDAYRFSIVCTQIHTNRIGLSSYRFPSDGAQASVNVGQILNATRIDVLG